MIGARWLHVADPCGSDGRCEPIGAGSQRQRGGWRALPALLRVFLGLVSRPEACGSPRRSRRGGSRPLLRAAKVLPCGCGGFKRPPRARVAASPRRGDVHPRGARGLGGEGLPEDKFQYILKQLAMNETYAEDPVLRRRQGCFNPASQRTRLFSAGVPTCAQRQSPAEARGDLLERFCALTVRMHAAHGICASMARLCWPGWAQARGRGEAVPRRARRTYRRGRP